MASSHDTVSMALFCDFENVALGVRDAKYDKFDIKRVLERLLLKGSIVVKKAYCDWERYKGFKATMHEASFELIEIPHVRQSGKNSADIRLVVDALDLCYTKSHVNTFVIISGDSDFSPLVSKLRENAKQVIGVGVKQSTSDLLIANCDEFIFYDDLVRESQRAAAKQDTREAQPAKRSPDEERRRGEEQEARRTQAVELAVETFDALVAERGDSGKIWASLLKEAIKRRKPGFNESYYGFRAFGNLLEEAQSRRLLELGRDEKSGTYVYRANGEPAPQPVAAAPARAEGPAAAPAAEPRGEATPSPRRHGRGRRHATADETGASAATAAGVEPLSDAVEQPAGAVATRDDVSRSDAAAEPAFSGELTASEAAAPAPELATEGSAEESAAARPRRGHRRRGGKPAADAGSETVAAPQPAPVPDPLPAPVSEPAPAATPVPVESVGAEQTAKRRPARASRKTATPDKDQSAVPPEAPAAEPPQPAPKPARPRRARKATAPESRDD